MSDFLKNTIRFVLVVGISLGLGFILSIAFKDVFASWKVVLFSTLIMVWVFSIIGCFIEGEESLVHSIWEKFGKKGLSIIGKAFSNIIDYILFAGVVIAFALIAGIFLILLAVILTLLVAPFAYAGLERY